ncbi:MAG TPA: ATP-binding protein [Bryobacteraceae bacterium]|jgi:hypothetical protein|nr:ATP-binding protein [Bryobacteraceae bacterium]
MSIFTKSLSKLESTDLQELLDQKAVENARLEFKLLVPNKEETLKKLSSFANTFGGLMVIGAQADSSDGRIQALPGVDVEAGYKQKVIQWSFDGASPPLLVEVSDPIPSPAGNGKVCYVCSTPESDVAPHFLNGRRGIWVRTDEFSARFEARLADETELQHLLDRRKWVRDNRARLLDRARRRFKIHAATIPKDEKKEFPSLVELCIAPRFPSRPLCQPEALKSNITTCFISWRGIHFPDPTMPILSQHESAIVLNATKDPSMLESNVWGMNFYGALISGEANFGTPAGIHTFQFVGFMLLFIRHSGKMLETMGYSGPIIIETFLSSILGVPWLRFSEAYAYKGPESELDDDVVFSISTTSEGLREKPDGVVMEVLRSVMFAVNSADMVDTQQKIEGLIHGGYYYNNWPKPDKLLL